MPMYMTSFPTEAELRAQFQDLKKRGGTFRDFLTSNTQRAFSYEIIPPKDSGRLSFDDILEKYGWDDRATGHDDSDDISSMYPDIMQKYDAMRLAADIANDELRKLVLK